MKDKNGQHLEFDPAVCGGRPRIVGTRITVADVVLLHLRLGHAVEQIAAKYDVSLAAVYSALAYYHDHRAQIDAAIDAEDEFAEAFRRDNPSPLRNKLRALSND